MKKLIAAVTTAGLLIVGTAGVAGAADSTTTTAPSAGAPAAKTPAHRALGRIGRGQRAIAALKIAATTIGIEPKALGQEIKAGTSVADVAKRHNVDPEKIIDAIDAAANQKIDAAVTAGKIDATRAATMKDRVPDRVSKLVNGTLKDAGKHRIAKMKLRRHARRAGVKVAADAIGIDTKALAEAVKGGQTVADVARSHDVDPQTVIDAVTTAANQKVDAAVTAGRIDSARATKLKDRLDQRITTLVNDTPHKGGAGANS